MQYTDNIKERLKRLRKELGLSQTDFGRKIGKNYHSVMRWELGKVLPPANVLEHISELFDVNGKWLFEGVGPMFRPENTVSEKQSRIYSAEARKGAVPYLESVTEAGEMVFSESSYILLPGIMPDCFAFRASFSASPPAAAGDTVICGKTCAPEGDGLYLIRDSYKDLTVRWFLTDEKKWTAKRPEYPDIKMDDALILGRVVRIVREIEL